jgi:F-type H+-transporting ATPase subunit delta
MASSVDSRVVKRYAGALFALALKHDNLDAVEIGLHAVKDAFKANPQLMIVLLHPRISQAKKEEILKRIFGEQVKDDVLHLLLLMAQKDRTSQIPFIATEFDRLLRLHRKEATGEVVSAVPLSEAQNSQLAEQLLRVTGFKVRLQHKIDPALLGGLVVRVGDHLIDSSVATQLNLLKERFKQVKVV